MDLPAITPDGRLALLSGKDVTFVDPEKLDVKSTVAGGANDFWYFFAWDGFRPRPHGLDQPVTFPGDSAAKDSLSASSTGAIPNPPTTRDTAAAVVPPVTKPPSGGFTVSFAALLTEDKAQQLANTIKAAGNSAHVVSTTTAGAQIFRVVMGPFATREEADKIGRASKREYWIYEGSP
jgi:hypothetical protein